MNNTDTPTPPHPDYGPELRPEHVAILAARAVFPATAAARGYRSVTVAELERLGLFAAGQRRDGLLIPIHDVAGEIATYQLRPDEPRQNGAGKRVKYETPARARMVLDVPPAVRQQLGEPAVPLYVTEGPIKADAAAAAGLCCVAIMGVWNWRGTNGAGGKVALACFESVALNGRAVRLVFDSDLRDNASVRAALARLKSFLESRGAQVAVIYLPPGEGGVKVGLDDWFAAGHTAAELERLDGAPAATMSLAGALDAGRGFVERFVHFKSRFQSAAVALWIAHTWVIDRLPCTPYLHITAPSMRSGKSRLLEVLELLVRMPEMVVNLSSAALFRLIEQSCPTVLIDEVDGIFKKKADEANADLVALLNVGHRRGATVPRCVGPRHDVQRFPAFCAKALTGIGELPGTTGDRVVRIRLERRLKHERIERFRVRQVVPEAEAIRQALADWAASEEALAIADAEPDLPEELDDRAQDSWEPLLAVADVAGGEWPALARQAAVALTAEKDAAATDQDVGQRLLSDIQDVVYPPDDESRRPDRPRVEKIATTTLITALATVDDAPWSDWRNGKPITATALAALLRRYEVRPEKWRDGHEVVRGYKIGPLQDAFRRYLSSPPALNPPRPPLPSGAMTSTWRVESSETQPATRNLMPLHTVADVAGWSPEEGGNGEQIGCTAERPSDTTGWVDDEDARPDGCFEEVL